MSQLDSRSASFSFWDSGQVPPALRFSVSTLEQGHHWSLPTRGIRAKRRQVQSAHVGMWAALPTLCSCCGSQADRCDQALAPRLLLLPVHVHWGVTKVADTEMLPLRQECVRDGDGSGCWLVGRHSGSHGHFLRANSLTRAATMKARMEMQGGYQDNVCLRRKNSGKSRF